MVYTENEKLFYRFDKEILCIEPWGENSLRIRATQNADFLNATYSALINCENGKAKIRIANNQKSGEIIYGKIRCEIMETGKLKFYNQKGELLLEEYDRNRMRKNISGEFNSALEIKPRMYKSHQGTNNYEISLRFESNSGERLYGMGQYQQDFLNLKGCELELAHRNSQISIPFVLSNKGYGFLWNNPAIGSVVFGKNLTRWTAQSSQQMDYWITADDNLSKIVENYTAVTGRVPVMPEYGTGFWQCKLRYQTQDEIMEIAREYKRRELPISVIVIDYFHWPYQGDWRFDKDFWPDPKAMVEELNALGIKLMVSIWPTVEEQSENFYAMEELGYLTRSERGKRMGQLGNACFIDMTNPEARKYLWKLIKKNYYDYGIKIFWLDEAEPEYTNYEFDHYRYYLGSDLEVGNLYPKLYAKMAYEGMQEEGQENIVNLLRCAWAGSQKYGTLVWSGDIDSSFRSLRYQLMAGLNMGLSGISWWTTDIGGFHGGNIHSEKFKECFIRWFQFGTFCPVFRLHGFREPFQEPLTGSGGGRMISGADNEVWSYGKEVYEICKEYMKLREKMRPYIMEQMEVAHEKGTPLMRPLFFDYPENKRTWTIEDQYMFGPDVIVCPILFEKQRRRKVYLPEGMWRRLGTGEVLLGENEMEVDAELENIPVYIRQGKLEEIR